MQVKFWVLYWYIAMSQMPLFQNTTDSGLYNKPMPDQQCLIMPLDPLSDHCITPITQGVREDVNRLHR